MQFLACSLFSRRSKNLDAASTPAATAAPIRAESLRSQPSFEAERAQHGEDIAMLTAERAKQQVIIAILACISSIHDKSGCPFLTVSCASLQDTLRPLHAAG